MFDWDEVCQTREKTHASSAHKSKENWKHIFWYRILFELVTPSLSIPLFLSLFISRHFPILLAPFSIYLEIWRTNIGTPSSIEDAETNRYLMEKMCAKWWKHTMMSSIYDFYFFCVYVCVQVDDNFRRHWFTVWCQSSEKWIHLFDMQSIQR